MKIIIAGVGDVGYHLAKQLSSEDHDISIIDIDESHVETTSSSTDVMSFQGSSTSIRILKDAGVQKTDLVVAVTSVEAININTAILAKKLGAKKTIARVSSAEYVSDENLDMIKSLGVDYLIYPEELAAIEIVKLIERSAATDIVEIEQGKLLIIGIKIESSNPIINLSMRDIAEKYPSTSFRVSAIQRGTQTIIPTGNDIFTKNDQVFAKLAGHLAGGDDALFDWRGIRKQVIPVRCLRQSEPNSFAGAQRPDRISYP